MLTKDGLQQVMAHATAARVEEFYGPLMSAMAEGAVDTSLRMAHFLAQVGHESGDLRYTEEIASGAAYEGRHDLGNMQPGDGVRFKGRGLLQITGRANYAALGREWKMDLLSEGWSESAGGRPGTGGAQRGVVLGAAWFECVGRC